jgi:DNA modification methylase
MMKKTLLINNIINEKLLVEPFRGKIITHIPEVDISKYKQVLVYDVPVALPFWYKLLSKKGFSFRYHIVIYFDSNIEKNNLIISHVGVLYAFKGKKTYINKVRIPHQYCKFCGRTLKDWGGKKHLMHPEGVMISDVWKHLDLKADEVIGKDIPFSLKNFLQKVFGEMDIAYGSKEIIYFSENDIEKKSVSIKENLKKDCLITGDAEKVLKTYPSNSIDMIFIDPPYNLNKNYDTYKDERNDYISWSLNWLNECFRVLKPNGSLFFLNIPKWIYELFPYLVSKYYFQRWIVWDNQAEPKGKLIPAHYPLLWFSKTPNVKTYPVGEEQDDLNFCLRNSCRKKREKLGIKDKIPVRDVRWDIHRVKHSHKRFNHPTQLPPKLLSFVIRLTTDKGDIVLDPMMGVGTTPLVAKELERHYIGIDISETYTNIAKQRIKENLSPKNLKANTSLFCKSRLTKKEIQIKIGELALRLGRIPSLDEFCSEYGYSKEEIVHLFPSWSKATKYAKLVLEKFNETGIVYKNF